MSSQENLCISYLDESKILNQGSNGSLDHYTVVALTAKWQYYIETLEPEWTALRVKHGIPTGQAIHFTDIRILGVPDMSVKRFKPEWLAVFSQSGSSSDTNIDLNKLHAFYQDVIEFIRTHDFTLTATGIRYDREGMLRQIKNKHFQDSTYRPPYYAFREHLNLMIAYLLNIKAGTYQPGTSKPSITKLRFDGDLDLGERDDLREAFNHSITLGTRHFRPKFARQVLDEIRFIGKGEVGHHTGIAHAGAEIVDLVATVVSRQMWHIDTHLIPVNLQGRTPLNPWTVIKPKIFGQQSLDDISFRLS